MSILKWGGLLLGALVVVIIANGMSHQDNRSPAEKIEAACQQEYGSRGPAAVQQCNVNLMGNKLIEAENAKMRRAADLAR